MSAHYNRIGWLRVGVVWLPVVVLFSSRWIIPEVGQAEFLIACAGWANLVAVIDIAREFNEKDSRIGWLRALVFAIPLFLFPVILAWDLTHILHKEPQFYWNIIGLGVIGFLILLCVFKARGDWSQFFSF